MQNPDNSEGHSEAILLSSTLVNFTQIDSYGTPSLVLCSKYKLGVKTCRIDMILVVIIGSDTQNVTSIVPRALGVLFRKSPQVSYTTE